MPQISPMSWILIISMFMLFILLTKNSLPKVNSEMKKEKQIFMKEKMLKW